MIRNALDNTHSCCIHTCVRGQKKVEHSEGSQGSEVSVGQEEYPEGTDWLVGNISLELPMRLKVVFENSVEAKRTTPGVLHITEAAVRMGKMESIADML